MISKNAAVAAGFAAVAGVPSLTPVIGGDYLFSASKYALNSGVYNAPLTWDYSRAGDGSACATAFVNGKMQTFADGVPRISDRGFLVEPAAVNRVTVVNANPPDLTGVVKGGDAAAVLSRVSDVTELAAAGLDAVCSSGMVYKLDNSAGVITSYVNFPGPVGATGNCVCAVWARGSGGSAAPRLTDLGGANATVLTQGYQKLSNVLVAPATTSALRVQVTAGGILYMILPNLVPGTATVTSTIINPTAAVYSRGADVCSIVAPVGATKLVGEYGTATTTTTTPTSNIAAGQTINIGASSGQPWVGTYLKRLRLYTPQPGYSTLIGTQNSGLRGPASFVWDGRTVLSSGGMTDYDGIIDSMMISSQGKKLKTKVRNDRRYRRAADLPETRRRSEITGLGPNTFNNQSLWLACSMIVYPYTKPESMLLANGPGSLIQLHDPGAGSPTWCLRRQLNGNLAISIVGPNGLNVYIYEGPLPTGVPLDFVINYLTNPTAGFLKIWMSVNGAPGVKFLDKSGLAMGYVDELDGYYLKLGAYDSGGLGSDPESADEREYANLTLAQLESLESRIASPPGWPTD